MAENEVPSGEWRKCLRGTWIGLEQETVEIPSPDGTLPMRCPGCSFETVPIDMHAETRTNALFEMGSYGWPSWMKTAQPDGWQPREHPGYSEMRLWAIRQEKRCFNHMMHMKNSYKKHMTIDVDIQP